MEFDNSPNIETIFIGGIYNKKLGGTIGACAIEQINNFNIEQGFYRSRWSKYRRKFFKQF